MGNWYDRENWYRMPERESQLVPATLSTGDEIVPRRIIVRCGYYYNYKDAPINELNEIAVNLLCQRTGHDERECHTIIQSMEPGGNSGGPFSMTKKYRSLMGVYYDARRIWVHQQPSHNGTPFNYRTFWYIDLPSQEDWWHRAAWWDSPLRKILGKELRMIGQPDVEYEYGEFGSSYCVGTFFNEYGRQTLYRVSPYINKLLLGDTDDWWYVHPLDAEDANAG